MSDALSDWKHSHMDSVRYSDITQTLYWRADGLKSF